MAAPKTLADALAHKQATITGKAEDGRELVAKFGAIEEVKLAGEAKELDAAKELEGFTLDFVISSSTVDRDNDIVRPAGGKLENWKKAKAPVLWAHDRKMPPIARAPNTYVDGEKVRSLAEVPSRELHPFGNMIGRLALHDFVGGASIGFIPLKWSFNEQRGAWAVDYDEWELAEWSILPVQSNPDAVQGAKSFGIDVAPLREWAEKMLDGEGGGFLLVPRAKLEETWKAADPKARLLVEVRPGFELGDVTPAKGEGDENEIPEAPPGADDDGDGDQGGAGEGEDTPPGSAPSPAKAPCALCERGDEPIDGFHVVGFGKDGRALSCKAAKPEGEPAADKPEGKKQPEANDVPKASDAGSQRDSGDDSGEDAPGLTIEDVERTADKVFAKARETLATAITGELPDF